MYTYIYIYTCILIYIYVYIYIHIYIYIYKEWEKDGDQASEWQGRKKVKEVESDRKGIRTHSKSLICRRTQNRLFVGALKITHLSAHTKSFICRRSQNHLCILQTLRDGIFAPSNFAWRKTRRGRRGKSRMSLRVRWLSGLIRNINMETHENKQKGSVKVSTTCSKSQNLASCTCSIKICWTHDCTNICVTHESETSTWKHTKISRKLFFFNSFPRKMVNVL